MLLKEKNIRSVVKGISWRFLATATTVAIIYVFFGKLTLAVAAGAVEATTKIILYWAHERIWQRIGWGIRKVEPFNVWFTGLPLSGKSTIARLVHERMKNEGINVDWIDSSQIRRLIPDIGYTRKERVKHLKRIAYLVKKLQDNDVSVICSFISPYEETRENVRKITKNSVIVYTKASVEECKRRDYKGLYEKALSGQIKHFTGISDQFEEPQNADIVIDTEKTSPEKAADMIVKYVLRRFVK